MRFRTVVALFGFLFVTQAASGTVITPGNFSSKATVETFDALPVGEYEGALDLNGVNYAFSPPNYRILAANPANYLCVSGNCLGNNASGAFWTITLSSPVNLVGGYLSGAGDNLVPAFTDITFYDASNTLLGSIHPVSVNSNASSPSFFGFESDDEPIKYIRIKPNSGPFVTTLDNFTTEILTPVPEPSTWAMLLLGFAAITLLSGRARSRSSTANAPGTPS